MAVRRVALIGFMAAGKTTTARRLARLLGWEFADLDAAVEERAGATIAELFRDRGEPAFRRLETECLRGFAGRERLVLAAGGGAALEAPNAFFFRDPQVAVFYLHVGLAEALGRAATTRAAAIRPLLARDPREVERLYAARLPRYRELATEVDTSGRGPEEVAEAIQRLLTGRLAD